MSNPTNTTNIWLGRGQIDFADMLEKVEVTYPDDVSEYLEEVKYVIDIHARKSSLAKMIHRVGISYAHRDEDFEDIIAGGTTNHDEVFTRQMEDGKSFDINCGSEVLGRMPAQLKKNFVLNVNPGADNVRIENENYPVFENVSSSLHAYVDKDGKPLVSSNLDASYSTINNYTLTEGDQTHQKYDDGCLAAGAIPKTISSQMIGFGNDENILRIVSKNKHYLNLLTFGLQGSSDNNDDLVKFNKVASSKVDVLDTKFSITDMLSMLNTDVNKVPSESSIGHGIIAAIFNQEPPNQNNCNLNGLDKLWTNKINRNDEDDKPDYLILNDTNQLEGNYKLQFILETSMNLIDGSNNILNKTKKSPDLGNHPDDKIEVLFNIIFDREGADSYISDHITVGNATLSRGSDAVVTIGKSSGQGGDDGDGDVIEVKVCWHVIYGGSNMADGNQLLECPQTWFADELQTHPYIPHAGNSYTDPEEVVNKFHEDFANIMKKKTNESFLPDSDPNFTPGNQLTKINMVKHPTHFLNYTNCPDLEFHRSSNHLPAINILDNTNPIDKLGETINASSGVFFQQGNVLNIYLSPRLYNGYHGEEYPISGVAYLPNPYNTYNPSTGEGPIYLNHVMMLSVDDMLPQNNYQWCTTSHEAGHWFGLRHTFGNSCDGPFTADPELLTPDIPGHPDANYGIYEDTDGSKLDKNSSLIPDTCSADLPSHADHYNPGRDPVYNVMNYTEHKDFMGFSDTQLDIMRAVTTEYMSDLYVNQSSSHAMSKIIKNNDKSKPRVTFTAKTKKMMNQVKYNIKGSNHCQYGSFTKTEGEHKRLTRLINKFRNLRTQKSNIFLKKQASLSSVK